MKRFIVVLFALGFAMGATAQKKVLIEHFSNASCSICGVYSPQVFSFAEQNKDNVVVLSYHTPFPYLHDSLHFENPADANARINYYGVTGTPYSIMEGNFLRDASANLISKLPAKTTERLNNAPATLPQVLISDLKLENGTATATVVFISTDDIKTSDLRGHVALVERVVPKTAYLASPGTNSEQEYKNVMRRMYMPQTGFTLQNKSTATGDTLKVSFATNTVKNLNQIRILAFIQNHTTKEVYQVQTLDAQTDPSSIQKIESIDAVWAYNVQQKQYSVTFRKEITGSITISDISGKTLQTITIDNVSQQTINVEGLGSGIYIAMINNGTAQAAAKLIVY